MKDCAVYIHVPFCARKCAYCDFESYAGRMDRADEYVARVREEMQKAKAEYGLLGVPSVYIGGGTPSLLNIRQLSSLFRGIEENFSLKSDAEISMEANPGTVTRETLREIRRAGVNRLSFGAQAFQNGLLQTLGRIHRWKDVENAAEWAQDAGISNYNIDLMYALPGQSAEDFEETLENTLRLVPKHISCYSLILEAGTPLAARAERGEISVPDDDAAIGMQRLAQRMTGARGFERYEISNYALPGFECRHNVAYWTRKDYLGLGCAAHSFVNGERFSNPSFDVYMRGEGRENAEFVSREGAMEETVMLETRMTRGLSLAEFQSGFGKESADALLDGAKSLARLGLARVENGFLFLTDEGLDVQNAAVLTLVSALNRGK